VSQGKVTIYKLAQTKAEEGMADENGLIPVSVVIPIDSKAPAKDAINHLITADGSPIPDGTELLGIKIDDTSGLATVDFSEEFVRNFKGGDKVEAQIINSVRATLGQFGNVQSVQLLVAGKKIAQLGGTIELSDPLPVIRLQDGSPADSNKGA
jgi:spore germination protein GerM